MPRNIHRGGGGGPTPAPGPATTPGPAPAPAVPLANPTDPWTRRFRQRIDDLLGTSEADRNAKKAEKRAEKKEKRKEKRERKNKIKDEERQARVAEQKKIDEIKSKLKIDDITAKADAEKARKQTKEAEQKAKKEAKEEAKKNKKGWWKKTEEKSTGSGKTKRFLGSLMHGVKENKIITEEKQISPALNAQKAGSFVGKNVNEWLTSPFRVTWGFGRGLMGK